MMYRCVCGHPYSVSQEGHTPWRDKFTDSCPTCGKTVSYKSTAVDVTFHFEKDWTKPADNTPSE